MIAKTNSALLSDEEFRQIAARSMTLYERVAGPPLRIPLAETTFRSKLNAWIRQAADGNEEFFRRRLGADGLDLSDLPGVIGGPAFASVELPEWCLFLKKTLNSVIEWTEADIFEGAEGSAGLPFYALARPFLKVAERRLRVEPSYANWTYSMIPPSPMR